MSDEENVKEGIIRAERGRHTRHSETRRVRLENKTFCNAKVKPKNDKV